MLYLNKLGAEIFVNKFNSKNQESFWNNYDIVIWKKNPGGYSSIKGMFRNDTWGTAENFAVNNQGIWELPKKYVKYFK